MKINQNTVLVGHKVVLVPYRKQHVPRYHEWMKDPLIQEQTASEPLSLDEEYEMQQSWAVDEDKLTFIILARPEDMDEKLVSTTTTQDPVDQCKMVGDVNIFFNEVHEDEDNEEEEPTDAAAKEEVQSDPAPTKAFDAECEIMIAEHSSRRKGVAREALQMMFAFVTSDPTPTPNAATTASTAKTTESEDGSHCTLPISSSWLTCKISLKNEPSIKLFESLGFSKQKVSEVWQEVEMRLTDVDADGLGQYSKSIQQVLFWADE